MARVFALDNEHCDVALRSLLQNALRVHDECVALPQAHRSIESGAFKNVVLNLNGNEADLSADIFSTNWFSGVSGVEVSASAAESILKDPIKRKEALQKLANAIPTELGGDDVTIGPELEGTDDDRDVNDWVAGFDSPSCCVGLYSAMQSKSTDPTKPGISRSHPVYFLVCKAGGGLSAQTFHSRLSTALKKGLTLDQALAEGSNPGAQALRRVSTAAQRNRGRILVLAAEVLGLHEIDTLADMSCSPEKACRVAVTNLNVVYNSISRCTNGGGTSTYQYFAGCVDSGSSQGVLSASNVAEGFLLFFDETASCKLSVKNQACSAVPFSSVRLQSNKQAVLQAAEDLKNERTKHPSKNSVHADSRWIVERFGWRGRDFGIDIEPPPLLGTYEAESFSTVWLRELGLSNCRFVRLQPEVVAISATEPAKLRAASRHVLGARK